MARLRRTLPTVLILLLFITNPLIQFGLGPLNMFGSVHAQTEPPASGDWIISDTTTKSSVTIIMKGNVTVKMNGRLTLDHVTLKFNSTAAEEYMFTVESGGQLYLKNTTIGSVSPQWRYAIDLKGKADIRGTTFNKGGRFLDPNTIKISYSDVLITQSTVNDANGSAIFIYPGFAPKINNNTINGGEFGIFVSDNTLALPGSIPLIYNNTVSNTTNTAIYIGDGTTPQVLGNRVFNPGNRGIHIQFTNAVVGHNYIEGATKEAGIFLYGGSNLPSPWINNNTIVDSLFGFTASGPSKGRFDNNTILSTTRNGIVLQWNTDITVNKNNLRWSGNDGIYLRELVDPMVRDNILIGNDKGIEMDSRALGTFYNNQVNGGRYGLMATGSSPTIQNNRFNQQSVEAINMTDSYSGREPVLSDNDITFTNIGIDVSQCSPLIQGNDIMETNQTGINLGPGASPQVLANNLTFNKGRGILVNPGATPVVKRNRMVNNLYGMDLEATHIGIEDNTFSGNDFAILCDQGTDTVFHNNTFDGSTFFDFLVKGKSHPTVSSSKINMSHVAADITSSLKVQWSVIAKVVNTKNVPEVGAMVTFRDNTNTTIVHSEKTKTGGTLSAFTVIAAEVTYGGIKQYGPFRVDIDKADLRNTTNLNIDRDINTTLYINHPPVLTLSDIYVTEDQPMEIYLDQNLTDVDGNVKDIKFSSPSPHVTFNDTEKTMTVLYTTDMTLESIQLNYTDGVTMIEKDILVHITPVNDPPRMIKSIPEEFEVREDVGWTLNLSEYFTDEENPDLMSFTCSVPDVIINNYTKTAIWNPPLGGGQLQDIRITAYDGVDSHLSVISNPFTIIANAINHRPIYYAKINDTQVSEDTTWRINLIDYFKDLENNAGMTFTTSDPRIALDKVGPETYFATWSPIQGDSSIIGLVITAHDAANTTLTISSQPINLTYVPVDQPPQFIPSCLEGIQTTVYPGQTWMLVLSDCFSDREHNKLNFTTNHATQFKIYTDTYGQVRAVYLPPSAAGQNITNLIFYCTQVDGDARGRRAMTTPINFTYFYNQTNPNPHPQVVFINSRLAWYVYGSIPVAIIATAAAFYSYRRIKFHKYEINDIFLIFNDGRLITHVTGSTDSSSLDKDILASMLTAIQDFVKESFSGREISSLKEMKYGEQNIVIERGIFAFLSVVVKGNVTEKLKDDMKDALRNIERTYANLLESWDGDNKKLGKIDDNLDELVKKQPKNIIDLLRSY